MDWRALVAGGVVGLGIAGYFMWQKKAAIEARGSAIEAGLAQLGETYAQEVARQSAEAYMRDTYGITPDRIEGISRLATALGVNTGS